MLAADGLTEGIACIAGTGSIAVGIAAGREERCGGWGYLLGDEGSGYWVVREALRELVLRRDTHAPLGPLGAAVMGATRCPDIASLLPALVRPSSTRRVGGAGAVGHRLRGPFRRGRCRTHRAGPRIDHFSGYLHLGERRGGCPCCWPAGS